MKYLLTSLGKRVSGRSIILLLVAMAVFVAVVVPRLSSPAASAQNRKAVRTSSHDGGFANYDIRLDKNAADVIAGFRSVQNRSASDVASVRDEFVSAESKLRRSVPSLKIEYNDDLRVPEVISPDVRLGKAFLTAARTASTDRAEILKQFLAENQGLIGARGEQVTDLVVKADYTNPDGDLSFVTLGQEINGIPVFRGEVKAGFTRDNRIVRVINNFAPGLDYGYVSPEFGDPTLAAQAAARSIGADESLLTTARPVSADTKHGANDLAVTFGDGDFAPKAEKTYFLTEPGVAVPAWRVLIWQPTNAYYFIVDAATNVVLWRKNITEDQTQPATYNVYLNPNSMSGLADNPFSMHPGLTALSGVQGTAIAPTVVTKIGNEPPNSFNNLGWIRDGVNTTDGNNVQAGLDRELPNSPSSSSNFNDIDPDGMATGSPTRVFTYAASPGIPTNPAQGQGDSPLPAGQTPGTCLAQGTSSPPTAFQQASVANLFFVANTFHDELYRLGFTEQAGNFQDANYRRGGLGGDRISAQAQDCSGTNNANFSTPADGTRPQMQMYIWTAPTPDYDGSFDAAVVMHELTHGVSNRLHGDGGGLFNDLSRGLGEGWSDFYSQCLLSQPSDPIDGVYPTAAYATYQLGAIGFNNNYYGIRRFPTAILAAKGGAQNRPHDPLTLADIDSTKVDLSDGAFAPSNSTSRADEVHNIGEVWNSMLWEVRAKFITRLGWAEGNRRILQIVTDGMKLAPLSPTPLSERDAMLAAAQASYTAADLADIWNGFAARGLGNSASIQNVGGTSISGGTNTVRLTEAFDQPNVTQSPDISVSDDTGDADGYPEPGETVRISVPVTNLTGRTARLVTAQIGSGPAVSYRNMNSGSTVRRDILFTIPQSATCGAVLPVTINVNSSLGAISFTRQFFVGRSSQTTTTENFDGVTAPAFPTGWTATQVLNGANFVSTATNPDTAPNSAFALDPSTGGGGTDLTSPPIDVFPTLSPVGSTVSFRNRYATESGWDGGVLEISIAGGAYQDIIKAGGTFVQNGYNATLGAGVNNPLSGRAAWSGSSNGYVTTIVQLPPASIGHIVQLRWRFGADDNTAVTGWNVDTIQLTGAGFVTSFGCSVGGDPAPRPQAPAEREIMLRHKISPLMP